MTPPTRIKICGVTRPDDALDALRAGADLLGLIFVPGTPRMITMERAKAVVEAVRVVSPETRLVGVFQNQPLETVREIMGTLSLDLAQLHGHESLEKCRALPWPVLKTLLLETSEASILEKIHRYAPSPRNNIEALLLDCPKDPLKSADPGMWPASLKSADPGMWPASPKSADPGVWPASRETVDIAMGLTPKVLEALRETRYFLAGRLRADTVGDLIRRYRPWGVDVASGVESAPGRKDAAAMRAFCRAVRAADDPLPESTLKQGDAFPR